MNMSLINPAYLAWSLLVLALFCHLPKSRALLIAFVGGMLFLPVVHMHPTQAGMPPPLRLESLVSLSKENVIVLCPLIAALLFDAQRLFAFRFRWFDLPMPAWCLCSLLSNYLADESLNNLYGQLRDHTLLWGVPYFLGRVYLDSLAAFREAVLAVVIGALVYMPFCLFEIVMQPTLHWRLYGYFQHDPGQTLRWGGHRPIVFMEHGLALSLWLVAAALMAIWLWQSGTFRWQARRRSAPLYWAWSTPALAILAALTRSTGALLLGITGLAALYSTRWLRTPLALLLLAAVPAVYMAERISGDWNGADLVSWLKANVDPGRAQSVQFRFANENLLIKKTLQRPWFGWGDTGHLLETGRKKRSDKLPIPDGLWILTFGAYGFVGLAAWQAMVLVPPAMFAWRYPATRWSAPELAPLAVVAVFLPLYSIDCLMNGMINPFYIVLLGGLASAASIDSSVTPTERRPSLHWQRVAAGDASPPHRRTSSGDSRTGRPSFRETEQCPTRPASL